LGSSLRAQGVYQSRQAGAQFAVPVLKHLAAVGCDECQSPRKVCKVTGFCRRARSDIEKIEILGFASPSASFNDVRRDGDRGTSELTLKSVPFRRWKSSGHPIDIENKPVSQRERAKLAMISAHDADATPKKLAIAKQKSLEP
jgi:hypothetical protein